VQLFFSGTAFRLGTFIRHRDGVAALEFALIAPILLLLLMGTVEFSILMYVQSVMEGAAYNASRLGKTGYAASGQTRLQNVLATINARIGGLVDTSQMNVSAISYGSWSQVPQNAPASNVQNLGGAGNVVVYTLSYPWHIATPLMQAFLGTNGTYTIQVRAVVQNEPF